MRGQTLRAHLHAGRRVYGIALEGCGQPRWPQAFAASGALDYVWIESEHAPNQRETIAWAVQLYAAYQIAPLVRIPEPSATRAAMAVDAGAHGVIAPYVETVEQVKALVGAVKYRPLKGEALVQALDQGLFPTEATRAYLEGFNPDAVLVIMIESPAGVRALPTLLAVPGVDAVLIGPHDLSIACGVPEDYDHPLFTAAIEQIISTARAHSVGVGMHFIAGSLEWALRWAKKGFTLISYRGDTLFVAEGIQQSLHTLRAQLDDSSAPLEQTVEAVR